MPTVPMSDKKGVISISFYLINIIIKVYFEQNINKSLKIPYGLPLNSDITTQVLKLYVEFLDQKNFKTLANKYSSFSM